MSLCKASGIRNPGHCVKISGPGIKTKGHPSPLLQQLIPSYTAVHLSLARRANVSGQPPVPGVPSPCCSQILMWTNLLIPSSCPHSFTMPPWFPAVILTLQNFSLFEHYLCGNWTVSPLTIRLPQQPWVWLSDFTPYSRKQSPGSWGLHLVTSSYLSLFCSHLMNSSSPPLTC